MFVVILIRILFVAVALTFFYLGLKLTITSFPNLLNKERLNQIEEITWIKNRELTTSCFKNYSPNQKIFYLLRLILKFRLLSYFVYQEQLNHLKSQSTKLVHEIDTLSKQNTYSYCNKVIISTKQYLQEVGLQTHSEVDYPFSLKKIEEIRIRLKDCFVLINEIETESDKIDKLLNELMNSLNSEIAEIAIALHENFFNTINTLNNLKKIDSIQLTNILQTLNEIRSLINELNLESNNNASPKSSSLNYYDILGIDRSASTSEIKKAYGQKCLQYHPDRKQDQIDKISDPEVIAEIERVFNEKMITLNEVYEILKDPEKRQEYDKTL